MNPEPHKQEQEQRTQHGNPRSPRTKHRSPILGYMVLLFLAAFILLVLSYFMQQRRNDQAVIDGLQQSISAMQTKQNISDQNKDTIVGLACLMLPELFDIIRKIFCDLSRKLQGRIFISWTKQAVNGENPVLNTSLDKFTTYIQA